MARLSIGDGLDTYIATLEQLTGPALDADMKRAIYEGAGVMMDAVKAEVNALPVYAGFKRGTPENKIEGVSIAQKKGLMDGLGISRMRYDGDFLNAKIGASRGHGHRASRTRWSSALLRPGHPSSSARPSSHGPFARPGQKRKRQWPTPTIRRSGRD